MSPTALEACALVDRIRDEERRTVWTREFEESLAGCDTGNIYPGMMFSLAKGRLEGTRLWNIVQRMPKGALLHAHMDAMIDVEWLFEQALATKGMYLYAPEALCSASALQSAPFLFAFSSEPPTQASSIWQSNYVPSTRVPVTQAAESFPDGGQAGFLTWLKDRCTITPSESVAHHHGLNAIWDKFRAAFVILGSIIFYEPIFRASVKRIFEKCLADGIRWVDLRAAFVFEYRRHGSDTPEEGYEEVIRVLGEEIERFQNTKEGKDFWGARMIWTTIRAFGKKQIVESRSSVVESRCHLD